MSALTGYEERPVKGNIQTYESAWSETFLGPVYPTHLGSVGLLSDVVMSGFTSTRKHVGLCPCGLCSGRLVPRTVLEYVRHLD